MAPMARRGRGGNRSEGKNSRRASSLISTAEQSAATIAEPLLPSADQPISQPDPQQTPPEPLLFEIGWEVCWQLGGIYTVLRSKAPAMIERWEDRYFLIGPYNPETAALEFEPLVADGLIRRTLDRMDAIGIRCHYGQWLIRGRPKVILIDHRAKYRDLDADKYLLWKDHGISTVTNDGEVNEVVAFGFAVTAFFAALSEQLAGTGRQVIAHFHEWMAGVAVPRISHTRLPISTVFTTHATLLGRYLASDSPDFYNHLPFIDPDAEAAKYNIYPRFAIERAAAHSATVFTTVSEVTSFEAEKLLGRAPELILPNGLNLQRFAALHEFQNLHREYKEVIHEFVVGHFFPSYSFDLDRTIYLFTSGRYEYRNKGMDLFVEALNRLNWRLKEFPDRPTVVAFLITRAATKSINVATLQSQSMFDELHKTCEQIQEQVGQRLLRRAVTGQIARPEELLDADEVARLKQVIHAWRTGRPPSIITHDLVYDAEDALLNHLRHHRLFNAAEDPVKVIFHPQFITRTNPLISLDYDQFVRGCHLGVFPSYYEPWGYTPMECVALGVPTITTDLSGFGAYVQHHITEPQDQGIYVLNRRTRSFDESVNEMVEMLLQFVRQNRRQRIETRNKVERLSEMFDWSKLIQYYNQVHDLALRRAAPYRPGNVEVRLV
jgi:glycogen synthase